MAITAGLVMAGVGAAGTIGSAFMGGGASTPKLSRADKRRLSYAQLQQDKAVEEAKLHQKLGSEQIQSAEEARLSLLGRLGEPGTYEQNFEAYREANPTQLAASGIFDTKRYKKTIAHGGYQYLVPAGHPNANKKGFGTADFDVTTEGKVFNPEKTSDYIMDTRMGRSVSNFAAEIDQLKRREGPLWDQFQESTVGTIYQNSASLMREQMDQISRSLASTNKGARQQGLEALMKVQAIEDANSIRQDALWRSALAIEEYTANLFMEGTNFLMDWSEGVVRDKFTELNNQMSRFYGEVILPSAIQVSENRTNTELKKFTLDAQAQASSSGVKDMVSGLSQILLGTGLQMALPTKSPRSTQTPSAEANKNLFENIFGPKAPVTSMQGNIYGGNRLQS